MFDVPCSWLHLEAFCSVEESQALSVTCCVVPVQVQSRKGKAVQQNRSVTAARLAVARAEDGGGRRPGLCAGGARLRLQCEEGPRESADVRARRAVRALCQCRVPVSMSYRSYVRRDHWEKWGPGTLDFSVLSLQLPVHLNYFEIQNV